MGSPNSVKRDGFLALSNDSSLTISPLHTLLSRDIATPELRQQCVGGTMGCAESSRPGRHLRIDSVEYIAGQTR